MRVIPLKERILVKPKAVEEKTAGGIFLPENAQEKTNEGEVVEVGENSPVKKGDKVLFEAFAGTEVKISGVKHLILNSKDIIAKIE
ncbi:MAG TPA: co-chaperone GroES [Candidatus Nanoarchaeia archaeon]|nr:co-chaperone GroES [Candidatus Nanoarchaeia archaeon]